MSAEPDQSDEPEMSDAVDERSVDEPGGERSVGEPGGERSVGEPGDERSVGEPGGERSVGEPDGERSVDEADDQPLDDAGEAGNGAAGVVEPKRPGGVRRFWPLAVLVIALVVAGAGLFSWSRAAHDDSIALARTRDAVLIAATSHIQTLNSLDYRHVDAGLATWAAVTTGTLHDQVTQVSANERKLLADQKKISTGKVVDAAVFSLDGDSATVIAAVEVTVQDDTQADAAPTVKRNRFSADMVDVHGKWLVENLQQVAVDIS